MGWAFIKVDLANLCEANLNGFSPFLICIIFSYFNISISHNSWHRGGEGKTLHKEGRDCLFYTHSKNKTRQKTKKTPTYCSMQFGTPEFTQKLKLNVKHNQ